MKNIVLTSFILLSSFAAQATLIGNLEPRDSIINPLTTPSRIKELPAVCKDRTSFNTALENALQNGPAEGTVKRILAFKADRMLYLLNANDEVVKMYPMVMGGDPLGHKQFSGDGKTPEGRYEVELKNSKSLYNLALKVSYPNKDDRAFAASKGKNAGGDIMIHGFPKDKVAWWAVFAVHPFADWTAGCIAVNDAQIAEIFELVEVKTLIDICP